MAETPYWRQVPASVVVILIFAVVVIAGGLWAMAALPDNQVSGEAIAALVGSVLGLVGAHIGHTTAHAQAREYMEAMRRLSDQSVASEGSREASQSELTDEAAGGTA
jgi:hypothetical protein